MPKTAAFIIILSAVLLGGCATNAGPSLVHRQRYAYNEEIIRSQNEQMLLNLVRLRYNDTPLFLELNTIVTQYAMENSAGLAALLSLRNAPDLKPLATTQPSMSASISHAERPTITYTPLQGEAFARQILTPIPPETIVLLSQSGWSMSRLMLLCVQRMNGVENAVTATGPTPREKPVYEDFQYLSNLFQTMQKSGLLAVDAGGESNTRRTRIIFGGGRGKEFERREDWQAIRRILGLPEGQNRFSLIISPVPHEQGEIAIDTRSLLGVLFFLSQSVEPPPEHQQEKLVIVTRDPLGQPFDWSSVLGSVMRIYSSEEEPERAFIKVRYRDFWFYISDSDLNSKATFSLLTYLFALQSAQGRGHSPLLALTTSAG